ncbi:tropomyosin-2-like [Mytilus edulis]|uniref:tropomyosin-2-like n=1 Tax=Mytilus edulis TaxID=6550 RepID=UPI0039EFAA7A
MASSTEGAGPYKSTVVISTQTTKELDKTETTASEQALNSTATLQNSDVAKPGMIEKAKTGQQRGGTKHENRIVGNQWSEWKPTGVQDLDAIRQILKEALEGGQTSMEVLHQKVQELIESKQRDTEMIEQLQQKTEELSRLLKEERERNEKHRTTQTQNQMTEKEKEIADLRKETTGLKEETEKLKQEVETLRTSLSKAAGDKLTDGNPTITDLSDPNRPQKLCEKFNSLYDNLWTDAFEHVFKDENNEKLSAARLVDIFRKCWEFCRECADRQLEMLQEKFVRPEVITEEMNRQGLIQTFSKSELKMIKDARKAVAKHTLVNLTQFYWKTKAKQKESLRPYVDACMEICWYAAINDPKLDFSFEPTKNKEDFRGYTKSGKFVDYLVWPAMYLHTDGPLLYKGVVQLKDNEGEREQM